MRAKISHPDMKKKIKGEKEKTKKRKNLFQVCLNSGSVQIQTLLAMCYRLAMKRIDERLSLVKHNKKKTIHHHHHHHHHHHFKKSDSWKIQLIRRNNFVPSKDIDEKRVMYSKTDSIEIMINDKADEVAQELVQSLLSRYQTRLETSIKDNDFAFSCVRLLY